MLEPQKAMMKSRAALAPNRLISVPRLRFFVIPGSGLPSSARAEKKTTQSRAIPPQNTRAPTTRASLMLMLRSFSE
jgi:hypothetical protein